ncbi:enoyl-CoA hydratase/carnithine racemase [Peribacillus deserti]|uniref:Enoyl-CoA hydratase/carnithine racemase n=1 Tax=Peribacillus deserti TaxID=673318 RepID=A0ABS2QGV6_9BACI|nr:enoyl-CoA hydratase/isomerase family protein [Peribacillus deserti]MBM7692377.1 enoyl-CoA hydratase/carnithine racemase [Peribacillus deserti]
MENSVKTDLSRSGLLTIIINRPEKRNAINFEVMDGLELALELAEQDSSIKAVMIRGEGNQAFCAGGDLKEFHVLKTADDALVMLSRMGSILYRLLTFHKPTIANINGTAVGGGCEIAAACDIRLADRTAKLGFVQGNQGITTGWGGASILYEKLPVRAAFELLLGADVHTAEKAKELGFIDYIISENQDEGWDSLQSRLLSKEAPVLMAYKNLLVKKWEASGLLARINEEIKECSRLWETDVHFDAVKRFMDKK